MKNTITFFLLCIFLSLTVYAKNEQKPAPATHAPIQFIENKGQITDQHGAVRRDIDVKVEANGVVMFVGDGEIHYQWTKTPPTPLPPMAGHVTGSDDASDSGASVLREQPTPTPPGRGSRNNSPFEGGKGDVEIYRMDVKLVGANKNAEVIFEEPTGYYENYYLAHTGEDGVRAKGFQRVVYKDIYPNIDLVLYTPPAPLKGSDIANGKPISNIQYPISNTTSSSTPAATPPI